MKRFAAGIACALVLSGGLAIGASQLNPFNPSGSMTQGYAVLVDPSGNPGSTVPPKLTAYGTLAVTGSSVALSTLTVGPNSPAWTTTYPSNYVSIRNSVNSAGVAYFCPLGGTCSASVGEPIAVGETIFRNVANATAITLFSTAGATVIAEE